MLAAFFKALATAAHADDRIWVVCGDVARSPELAELETAMGERYVDLGGTHPSLVGTAVGLAAAGKSVFVLSRAGHIAHRAFEQLRDDVCMHRAKVIMVALESGLCGGILGPSHHAVDDLAIMRLLPGMTVVAPGDPAECELLTARLASHDGPAYLRLGSQVTTAVHERLLELELGRSITVRSGDDLTMLSTGTMLAATLKTANVLARLGFEARVLSVPTVKPLDEPAIKAAGKETHAVVTVEEHSVLGGFGSAVAEFLAASPAALRPVARLGLADELSTEVGDRATLIGRAGLEPTGMLDSLKDVMRYIDRCKRWIREG